MLSWTTCAYTLALRITGPWKSLSRETSGAPSQPQSTRYTGWLAKGIMSSISQKIDL